MPKSRSKNKRKKSKFNKAIDNNSEYGMQDEGSPSGSLMSLRQGFKNLAGSEPAESKSTAAKVFDILFWVALAALFAIFMYKRFAS